MRGRNSRRAATKRPAGQSGRRTKAPTQRIRTELGWDELVLPAATLGQLDEVRRWIDHGSRLLEDGGMRGRPRPGFTCLFHGPPGTGKTLAAGLLGKHCGRDVYRIDLGELVSKYVGETEKNLARVFDLAGRNGGILFIDEADALFGRRTGVRDARDRYANLAAGFLLQRAEDFEGVVIFASNLKGNIDAAFARRLRFVVHFPMPGPAERLRLWRGAFPGEVRLDAGVDLLAIAKRYEVSGGTIVNAARRALLTALARGGDMLRAADVEEGLRRSG